MEGGETKPKSAQFRNSPSYSYLIWYVFSLALTMFTWRAWIRASSCHSALLLPHILIIIRSRNTLKWLRNGGNSLSAPFSTHSPPPFYHSFPFSLNEWALLWVEFTFFELLRLRLCEFIMQYVLWLHSLNSAIHIFEHISALSYANCKSIRMQIWIHWWISWGDIFFFFQNGAYIVFAFHRIHVIFTCYHKKSLSSSWTQQKNLHTF